MKDPAVLFYIGDWLTSTAEMDADCRGWYLNLLLHNYDKGDLPNDLEKLAVLCNVKFSEYQRFEQVFEQVLKQKFEQKENLRLTNHRTNEILQSRDLFKDKRSMAGRVSYMMKYFAKHFTDKYKNIEVREFVKNNFNYEIDFKNEQLLKQVFKQVFELYINENENENKGISKGKNIVKTAEFNFEFIQPEFKEVFDLWIQYKKERKETYKSQMSLEQSYKLLLKHSNNSPELAVEVVNQTIGNNWAGLQPLKKQFKSAAQTPYKDSEIWK